MVLGIILFFFFLFLLGRVILGQLFAQYCGMIASFVAQCSFNSSTLGLPRKIDINSTFPQGYVVFRGVHSNSVELSISRYACVERVLEDGNFTGVSFAEKSAQWTASVWSNADKVAIYDRNSFSGWHNNACVNEMTSVALP